MEFRKHSQVKEGDHAYLGASKYHWINYDLPKLEATYKKRLATDRGTKLHAFAAEAINLGMKLAFKGLKSLAKAMIILLPRKNMEQNF